MRELIELALYDASTRTLDLARLPATAHPSVTNFFARGDGADVASSRWFQLCQVLLLWVLLVVVGVVLLKVLLLLLHRACAVALI